jgi:DNA polymerase/3'-5' exonuclease PolX
MTDKQTQLADTLDEYATFLKLDGQDGRAHGYERAARKIRQARYLPPDPSDIDGIGASIRQTIAQYQVSGQIDELESLREEYSWFNELKDVKHIGPSRAEQLHEQLHVDSLDDLLLVARNGDLTLIDGVGPVTAQKIHDSAKELSG